MSLICRQENSTRNERTAVQLIGAEFYIYTYARKIYNCWSLLEKAYFLNN